MYLGFIINLWCCDALLVYKDDRQMENVGQWLSGRCYKAFIQSVPCSDTFLFMTAFVTGCHLIYRSDLTDNLSNQCRAMSAAASSLPACDDASR